jgi:hypothetical protein
MTKKHHLSSSNPVPSGPRRFETKRVVVRPLALQVLTAEEISEAIERHFRFDWGDDYDLTSEDRARMDAAFAAGREVMSSFHAPRPGPCPFIVVTNAERMETRVESEWDDTPEEQERTKLFLLDFAALLKKHGLLIRQHSSPSSDSFSRPCSFYGDGFVLDVAEAVDWLNAAEPFSNE